MTRILLTNDDGIHSEGLQTLERTLREVGDVFVIAPAAEMSGASHSLTLSPGPFAFVRLISDIGLLTARRLIA